MTGDAPCVALLVVDRLRLTVARRTLLRSLSLEVRRGELWCVLGANGAGKTLLLHSVLGVHPRCAGTIELCGRPLDAWRPLDAARVRSFLPQVLHDAFPLPAIDAVMAARHPYLSRWGWGDDSDRVKALEALAAAGVASLAERDVMTLSGGERQRVAIAAVIAQETPLVLLDEPLAHLDLHHQIRVLERLHAMAVEQGRGVMLSMHDINLARRFATHALLFNEDATAESGPVADVLNAENLSRAFGHRIACFTVGGRTVFAAD
jgi:iron complex transport system ATP-binding protein